MEVDSQRGSEIHVKELFPPGEGCTETLGINLPPSIASAIRRTGNRKNSISAQFLDMIDAEKLKKIIDEDSALQTRYAKK